MTVGRHIRQLQEALMSAQPTLDTAGHWGRVLADVLPRHQRLLVAGNGGSAAQAQHLTAELVGRYPDDREPFAALALHSETSALTAIVDEYGAESMYARQVLAHGQQGDVCLLMSTSGHSRNLLAAAHAARQRGLRVWAMTGPRGNPLAAAADDALCVETAQDYTILEVHLVALHVLCEEFERALQVAGMAETSS